MKKPTLTALLICILLATQALAADPQASAPPGYHHEALGIVMMVGGVALVGAR